jgi:hypothetical protein
MVSIIVEVENDDRFDVDLYEGATQERKERIKDIWRMIDDRANPRLLKALLYLVSVDIRGSSDYCRFRNGEEIYNILFDKAPSKASVKDAIDVIMSAPYCHKCSQLAIGTYGSKNRPYCNYHKKALGYDDDGAPVSNSEDPQ